MKSLDNQTEYWDSVVDSKSFTHPIDIERFTSLVSKEQKILDYGCGYGRTCEELWRCGYRNIIGVDTSEKMIERGKKEFPYLSLQIISNSCLQFEDNSFDMVILFAVLTCVPTNQGQKQIIKESSRILKKGSLIYVSDYWLQDDDRNRKRYERSKDVYDTYGIFEVLDGGVLRHHDKLWIKKLFSNFETIDFADIDVITMNGNKAKAFQYFGRKK